MNQIEVHIVIHTPNISNEKSLQLLFFYHLAQNRVNCTSSRFQLRTRMYSLDVIE